VRDLWAKDLQQAMEQQQMTASTAFGPLANTLSMLASISQSVRKEGSQTPPPTPSARDQPSQINQSNMMTSSAGAFNDSIAAALSASSMMKSMQQSSFIQAPTARYYSNAIPHNIQERDMRALEMSMNALAVTELLMARGSIPLSNPNAYGSIAPNPPTVPSTSNTPFRRPQDVSTMSTVPHRGAPTMASNIWGVPEESVLMEVSDNEGSADELDQLEQGNSGNDLPPSAFNV
jgi:hypothetical protein